MKAYQFEVLRPDGSVEPHEAVMNDAEPSYDQLCDTVEAYLDGGEMEHVAVLNGSGKQDMFVDEMGQSKHLRYNSQATRLYRAAWLKFNPGIDPSTLPWIAGVAILFKDLVWS